MTTVGNTFYFAWEVNFMTALQGVMGSFLTTLASLISYLGEEIALVAVVMFLYLCISKEAGEYIGENVLAGLIWNPMIKNVTLRRRPYMDHESIKCLRAVDKKADIYDINAQGFSFPSSHATCSVTCYGSAALFFKKNWLTILSAAICLLVSLTRVAMGVHYPTDVMVGLALGGFTILFNSLLRKYIKNRDLMHLVLILLGIPGCFFCRTNDFYAGFGIMIGFFAASFIERKYINFSMTRNVLRMILRPLVAFALFYGISTLFKLPFDKAFLESETALSHLVRAVRYAVSVFVVFSVYPLAFKLWDKKDKKLIRK